MMTIVDTGLTRKQHKVKRLTLRYWYTLYTTQHDQIIMNGMNKRHFFACWLNAYKLIIIRNKYLSKGVIKAWYNYVIITLDNRRKRVGRIRKAVGILDMQIMHMYHKLIHKFFKRWKSNKIEIVLKFNNSNSPMPRRGLGSNGLGRRSLMKSKGIST